MRESKDHGSPDIATDGTADSTRSNSAARTRARSQFSADRADALRDTDSTARVAARVSGAAAPPLGMLADRGP